MAVVARGSGFQAKFMLAGTRYVEQFQHKADAEAWEADCRAAFARGQAIPAAHAGTSKAGRVADLEGLLRHVEEMHWRHRKSGQSLAVNGRLFVDWVGPRTSVSQALNAETVDRYVRWRETEKRNSSATINRHLSAISVLIKHGKRLKLIEESIELPWQREGQGRLRYYEDREVEAIFALLDSWSLQRVKGLFIFLVDTGARLGEAEKLKWTDIRGRSITFTDTKNGLTRTVTGTPRVMEMLNAEHATGDLFGGPFHWLDRQHLRTIWDRVRAHLNLGDDCVIHTFRHTCASRLVQRGVDLYRVQRWMGHKNVATTMRYAHLAPKHLEELADVLAA